MTGWVARVGGFVRYRNAAGRVRGAIITGVTSQTTLNLRIGNGATKATITGATKKTHGSTSTGAGWFK